MNYNKIEISGGDTAEPINVGKRLKLIDNLCGIEGKKILDCGCGAGSYVVKLMEYPNTVLKGIEFDEAKVDSYKKQFPENGNVIQGDIEKMPFADNQFDLVILNEVLEHVPNQDLALSEIYRVLKPQCQLIIFSPNRFYPFETHGVKTRSKNKHLSKLIPFIPYLPIWFGEIFFYYPARNYFPMELKGIVRINHFVFKQQTFISQTFEGIGGNLVLRPFRKVLRFVFDLIEKIPVLRIPFCVSQVIVAKKA